MQPDLLKALDEYLDRQGHSEEAHAHSIEVLTEFEWAVDLAKRIAFMKLGHRPVQECVIIQFPLQNTNVSPIIIP